jgi:hypothetical protein
MAERGQWWKFVAFLVAAMSVTLASPAMARAGGWGSGTAGRGPDAPTYASTILADGPTMYWRLGDLGGLTAVDSSGNGHDGIYHGDIAYGQPGAIFDDADTSIGFDGTCDFMSWKPGALIYRGPFTVEAWVRPNLGKREHDFFSTRRGYLIRDFSFHMKLSTRGGIRGVRVGVGDGTKWFANVTIPFVWTAHTWYDVVAVADVTGVTVYVDGAPVGTLAYSGTPLLFDRAHIVTVGQVGYGAEWFDGQIDEVSVYEYALTPAQIDAHYIAATSP